MPGRKRAAKNVARPRSQSSFLKFRTRWRHVLLIDQRIRSGQAPNCRDLAGELEVSRRTILRDIDFLRYDLGAPVEYDAARRGYIYTEPNWDMPSVRITEGELFALMVAEQALEAYSGAPWVARLRNVFDRMVASLPDRVEVAPRELLPRVSFDADAASIVDPAVLETVSEAIRDNRTLRVRYFALSRGRTLEYIIDPYVLRRARGAWYLAARDRRRGRVPMFNLSRVRSAEPTGATFDYDAAGFDSGAYFDETFGVHQTSERYRVVIEFRGWSAQLVRERRWHASQKLTELPRGRLRFEVQVAHMDDVWPWVLSWGGEARVVAPRELRRIVSDQGAAIATTYRKKKKGG